MSVEKYKAASSYKGEGKFDYQGWQKRRDEERAKYQLHPSLICRESKDPERDIKLLRGIE